MKWNSLLKAGGRANHEIISSFSWIGGLWPACRQWLRQEEKTKKKWLNEWVSPAAQFDEWNLFFFSLFVGVMAAASGNAPQRRENKRKTNGMKSMEQKDKQRERSSVSWLINEMQMKLINWRAAASGAAGASAANNKQTLNFFAAQAKKWSLLVDCGAVLPFL